MKKFTFSALGLAWTLLLFGWTNLTLAQGISGAVTISPANATGDDTITITFDPRLSCSAGTPQSLLGETDVRIHSGVTINGSIWNNGVWFYQSGANGQSTQLTANPDSTYSITLVPRWYYGVNPGVEIQALDMVFNNNSWNKEGKDFDSPGHCIDFHIPLQVPESWNHEWFKVDVSHDPTARWMNHMSTDGPDLAWGSTRILSGNAYPGYVRMMFHGTYRQAGILYNYPGYRSTMISSAGADTAWMLLRNISNGDVMVVRTTDGGWNWQVQADSLYDHAQGAYANSVHFWDSQRGILLGDPLNGSWDIFLTQDGGSTWNKVPGAQIPAPLAQETGLETGFAVAGNSIFFGTNASRLFISNDFGQNWSAHTVPIDSGTYYKLTFANAQEGWLLENGTQELFHTEDGGASWTQISYTGTIGSYRFLHVPGTSGVLASSGGAAFGMFYSIDGGLTWQQDPGTAGQRIYGFCFGDKNNGWAGSRSDSTQNLPLFRLITSQTPVVGTVSLSKERPCQGENITAIPDILVPVDQYEWFLNGCNPSYSSQVSPTFTGSSPGQKNIMLRIHNSFGSQELYYSDLVSFRQKPLFSLGQDTSLCTGQCIDLQPRITNSLFFSEYIEGSGYNRALEIYNGTGQTVDMHHYAIWKNFNGSNWDGVFQFPTGTSLAQGEVLVIAHAQADTAILAHADIVLANNDFNFMMGYTGDDVRALVSYINGDTTIIDIIGSQDLNDPGMAWRVGSEANGTMNHTLVRRPEVDKGQAYWENAAGTWSGGAEWDVYPMDDFSHLGSHTAVKPYEYLWANGDTNDILHYCPPAQSLTTVSLRLTDAWDCYRTDEITVSAVSVNVDITGETSICRGSCTQLSATAGSTYLWNTGDTTQTITVCPQYGEHYDVTVTDANGCIGTATHFVSTYVIQVEVLASDDTICRDEPVLLSAPGYVQYNWSTGDTTPTTLAWHAGSYNLWYYVTVTDTMGCVGTGYINIHHAVPPNASISGNLNITEGECTQLTVNAGDMHRWSTGDTGMSITVCPLVTTTYFVESWYSWNDPYGHCTDTAWVTVFVSPAPQLIVSPDTLICPGDCITLWASGEGTFLWSTGSTDSTITVCPTSDHTYSVTLFSPGGDTIVESIFVDVLTFHSTISGDNHICEGECIIISATGGISRLWSTGQTDVTISVCPDSTTTYFVSVTSSNGCVKEDSVIITVYPLPMADAGPDDTISQGHCTTLTAAPGGAVYHWSDSIGGISHQVCPSQSTTYYLTVIGINGCLAYDSVTIVVLPAPQLDLGPDTAVCPGECVTLYASGNGSFQWSTGTTGPSVVVCPPQTTIYYVTMTDGFGQQAMDSVTVTVLPPPQVTAYGPTGICEGSCVTLSAGGSGSYEWSTGETFGDIDVCPPVSSTYYLTLTDANGCVAVDSITIEVFPLPPAYLGQDTSVCAGECINLTASGGIDYQWSVQGASGHQLTVCPSSQAQYSVTVTDVNGCINTASVSVGVYATPLVSISPDTNILSGNCVTLSASGGLHYAWSGGEMNAQITACPSSTTTYTVTVWSADGCTASAGVTVGVTSAQFGFSLKAYLAGAWMGNGMMRTDRAALGSFPLSQPYNRAPWNYTGQEAIDSVPPDVVDWLLLELRSPADCTIITERHALLLRQDGSITDAGGNATLYAASKTGGYGYIVLDHLSHMPVMTAQPVDLTNGTLYDLSDTLTCPLFGGSSHAALALAPGVHGMVCGDLNVNKKLQYSGPGNDRNLIPQRIFLQTGSNLLTTTTTGYFAEDLSMNGVVQYSGPGNDPLKITQSLVGMTGSTAITTIYTCPVPDGTLSFQCGDILSDERDGRQYPTVQIGNQCWMAANLNIGTMLISVDNNNNHTEAADNGVIEKFCYDNIPANCDTYGALYTWDEAMGYATIEGAQGICPDGWHIPADAEWNALEAAADSQYDMTWAGWNTINWRGTDVGGNLKEAGTQHWTSPNTGATNSTGFTALPTGYRYYYGNFQYAGSYAFFWSSSAASGGVWRRGLLNTATTSWRHYSFDNFGFAIRCMKDTPPCTPQPDQADAGPDSLSIDGDSIVLYANIPTSGTGSWSLVPGPWSLNTSFSDSTSATSIFYGQPGESYTLVWTISTICGSTSDTLLISFVQPQFQSCGDIFTDPRDSTNYPTVQIGDFCWFAANLNYGNRINASQDMSDNGQAEKHCYNDDPAWCDTLGGLYQWDEVMDYNTQEGAQGFCPPGWHISTNAEWKNLEGSVDSQFGVGDTTWDIIGWRGYDAGKNLKSKTRWNSGGNGTDLYGFTAYPAGRSVGGVFNSIGVMTYFWVSQQMDSAIAWSRYLRADYDHIRTGSFYKNDGRSVRCVMDLPPCTPQPDQADAGPDSLDIPGDSIVLYANTPSSGTGSWSLVPGPWSLNASFSDSTSATSIFYGQPGDTFALVWTISTICGSTSDTVLISFSEQGWACGQDFTDPRDGRQYTSTHIGSQCWMAQGLNYGQMISLSTVQSDNSIPEKHCYANDSLDCLTYGALYNWNEAMGYSTVPGSQGLCPDGWHIPTDADYKLLEGNMDSHYGPGDAEWDNTGNRGSDAGRNLKSAAGWQPAYNGVGAGTDLYGFNTKPSGYRNFGGGVSARGYDAYLWTSDQNGTTAAWERVLYYNSNEVSRVYESKSYGFAVRCVHDSAFACGPVPDQADAGPDQLNLPGNNVTMNANMPAAGLARWEIISTAYGFLSDSTDPNANFTGIENAQHTLVWIISTLCGISADTVHMSFTGAYPNCGTITDSRDGQTYRTVIIGNQCWMRDNLNVGSRIDGSLIQTDNDIIEKYCYGDLDSMCTFYGGLYQWNEMMDHLGYSNAAGICPAGWHIPTYNELDTLMTAVSDDANAIKAVGEGIAPWGRGTNISGFSALLAGQRDSYDGAFSSLGQGTTFYSRSTPSGWPARVSIWNNTGGFSGGASNPGFGYPVRCVKD